MIRHGEPPYLECSTRGEQRLSPFFAKPACLDGYTIEQAYHAAKVFDDGSTGLTWRDAKAKRKAGHAVVNQEECNELYSFLWDRYMEEHPELLELIRSASGLSDMFGQPPGPCQATELWRIRNAV